MQKITGFLRKECHSSWLLASLSAGVLCGVYGVRYFDVGSDISILILAGLFIGVGLWRGRKYALFLLFFAGILIGSWRASESFQVAYGYKTVIGTEQRIVGEIAEDPGFNSSGHTTVRLQDNSIDGQKIGGKLWVSLAQQATISRGDYVEVFGKIYDGFGPFSASMYRARLEKITPPESLDVALAARDWFGDQVRKTIDEPAASLGMGFIAGQRRALPSELLSALQIAGLMHIVVASGYNLTILVRFSRKIFGKVSRKAALVSSAFLILGFIEVTGQSPSMARAGLVAIVSLLAWFLGRKFHPVVLIVCAAATTALVDTSYLQGDLGWQLSFVAFAGVLIVAPVAQRYFFGQNEPGVFRRILGETLAAQITTLPILLMAFGTFSNVAVVANIAIVPLVPLVMFLVLLAGVSAAILPEWLAQIVAFPAQELLNYMIWIAQSLSEFSWANGTFSPPWWFGYVLYGAISLGVLYMIRVTKFKLRETNITT